MAETEDAIIIRLESIGESEVRARLPSGEFGDVPSHPYRRVTEDWLASKASARADADSSNRDAREEETLSIARQALADAKLANIIAIIAAIIAIVAIILSKSN